MITQERQRNWIEHILGRAITKQRLRGGHNHTSVPHKFLVLTVKQRLNSAYIYRSCRKIKTGV